MPKKRQTPAPPRVKFRQDSLAASLLSHPVPISPEKPTLKSGYSRTTADNYEAADPELADSITKCQNQELVKSLHEDALEEDLDYRTNKLRRLMFDQTELYQRFLATIRVGSFQWVAAEAIRVSHVTLSKWLKRGEAKKKGLYRQFYLDVMQAQAQARLTTEIQVRKDNPEFWLRNGPGKSRPGKPGWTETTVVEHGDQPLQINVDGTVQHQHAHIHIPVASEPSLEGKENIPLGNKSIKQLTQERANPTLSGVLTILEEIGIANLSKLGKSTRGDEPITVPSVSPFSEEPVNSPSTEAPISVSPTPVIDEASASTSASASAPTSKKPRVLSSREKRSSQKK